MYDSCYYYELESSAKLVGDMWYEPTGSTSAKFVDKPLYDSFPKTVAGGIASTIVDATKKSPLGTVLDLFASTVKGSTRVDQKTYWLKRSVQRSINLFGREKILLFKLGRLQKQKYFTRFRLFGMD